MRIKIHVTKDILERAKFCLSRVVETTKNCAIALAVRDIFPDAMVECFFISPFGAPEMDEDSIELPRNARAFIFNFDISPMHLRPLMDPISFDVNVPDSVIEKIGISQVEKILSESKNLERV